jgi:very-short-patch-repair endonuclease
MPPKTTTPKIMHRAGELRQNQTEAEAKLWSRLRAHRMAGVQFRRQHAIGNYIVDFCSPRRKLIIELDGSQHLDQAQYDLERTRYFESKGYRVLRFWNHDVMNKIDAVLNTIWNELNSVLPPQPPAPPPNPE